jgi:signal transduction histidine kinase
MESLLAKTPEDDPRRKSLQVVAQESHRMGELVANLLQFSRRNDGQISTVDIRDEIANAIDLIHQHLRKRQVAVVKELAAATPIIYADRQKLRQMFLNLLSNAGDAMPQGGKLTVRTTPMTLSDGKAAVKIEFADTGVGIPGDLLDKVMDPFFTTKAEGQGTGLGLAICKRIVQEHQGSIQIQSEIRVGTTVAIVLPVTHNTNPKALGEARGKLGA